MKRDWLDARPIVVAIAGPNGAGKTTFYHSFLASSGLRFVNADEIAGQLGVDPYTAASVAEDLRTKLVAARESFLFETVFSDPVGAKLDFLLAAAAAGYGVALCFIGISSPEISEERVSMRIAQGGHEVDPAKLVERYPRTMANLARAVERLPQVLVFDNDDLASPYRRVAEFESGKLSFRARRLPAWLAALAK